MRKEVNEPVVAVDALEGLEAGVDVEVLVESEDGGEALLADGADERLGAVGKPAMLHHLRTRRERLKLNTNVAILIQYF